MRHSLICSPWDDRENLFTPGRDYLVANNSREMREQMRAVLNDRKLAASLASHGLRTIESRHTCKHRVEELMGIYAELNALTPDST